MWLRVASLLLLCVFCLVLQQHVFPTMLPQKAKLSTSPSKPNTYRPRAHPSAAENNIMGALAGILDILHTAENATGGTVPCRDDATLPKGLPQGVKYLLAMNLHNNEYLMPHNLISFIHVLSQTSRGNVFVSVYESGSEDSTARWLGIFSKVLQLLQVPHRIHAGKPQQRNYDKWEGGRIQFLAHLRNAALSPLWTSHSPLLHLTLDSFISNTLPLTSTWPAEHVIFINDVYFCEQDMIRLAYGQGNVTCAMDFFHFDTIDIKKFNLVSSLHLMASLEERLDALLLPDVDRNSQHKRSHEQTRTMIHKSSGISVMHHQSSRTNTINHKSSTTPNQGRSNSRPTELPRQRFPPMAQPSLGDRCMLYDIWVDRDVTGNQMSNLPPYSRDPWSNSRVLQGLPIPVKCCWNGMVRFPAQPFRAGLRFRSHTHKECASSECSLLCDDLVRLGYSHFVMDPSVRLGYDPPVANGLYTGCVAQVGESGWANAVGNPITFAEHAVNETAKCCELKHGSHNVDFQNHCFWYNPLKVNYTDKAISTGFKAFLNSAFIQRRMLQGL